MLQMGWLLLQLRCRWGFENRARQEFRAAEAVRKVYSEKPSKKMKIFETSNGREWVGMCDCCREMLEKTEMFAHYSPLKLRKGHREKPKGP